MKTAWTRRAWPRCGPAPRPAPVTRASAPAPTRAAPPSAHASCRSCGCSPTAPPTPSISKTLHISLRTTEHHVEHILTKLDVTSRTAAVAHALTHELLT